MAHCQPVLFIEGIKVFNISTVGYVGNTNTLLSVGITTSTNYFVNALQIGTGGAYGVEFATSAISNAGKIFSTTTGIPLYGYFTNVGVTASSNFAIRVAVRYVQN